ncbi:MAG: hypoxanthine phosphoribosyltransferase [Candidatus Eisenbacteria bacterium]|nr:hypoxanthine phosphoribosyltransferase [Candidatus Eisenbacteria bacterium]
MIGEGVRIPADGDVEVYIGEEKIRERVAEMGERITRDYQGKDLFVVAVLRGAIFFAVDLVRHIDLPLVLDFVQISSYGDGTESDGRAKITRELDLSIKDKDVLVVEDIADTRHTLFNLLSFLSSKFPRSIRICTLLDKRERMERDIPLDYVGFTIENKFVIGYGLDYAQRYRNLPYVGILRQGGEVLK